MQDQEKEAKAKKPPKRQVKVAKDTEHLARLRAIIVSDKNYDRQIESLVESVTKGPKNVTR